MCQKMCEATTCDQLFVEFLASLSSLCISLAYSSICDIPVVHISCIYLYSISSLCVSREMVYLRILSLHLPMDYVFWYCFLFMRFSDLKNKLHFPKGKLTAYLEVVWQCHRSHLKGLASELAMGTALCDSWW